MNTNERLNDEKFQNWVKAHLGLVHTREGLIDFVTTVVETFHQESLSAVNDEICSQCQTENIVEYYRGRSTRIGVVRPCPKGICHKLREIIKENHYFHTPSWKNTHAERWCDIPWEMAKCFMPPDGYLGITTIDDTDLNGILSVMINLTRFNLSEVSREKLEKVREIGNTIRHCPELSVEDADVKEYLDKMILLMISFEPDLHYSTDVVNNLRRLKTHTISIYTEGVNQVVQDAIRMDYETRKSELKEDLLMFYQDEHCSVIVSPLVPANEVSILEFYVQQRMESVEWRGTNASRKLLSTYRELFTEGSRNIYIAAEAGAGKTTLMKHLCAEWCKSQKQHGEETANLNESGSDYLKRFDFLFLILLTDVQDECDVDEMIKRQIIASLSRFGRYDNNFLEQLLHQEKCLVLLDGLDEWSHSKGPQCQKHLSIPHRKSRTNWTILSTSRPWKIHSAQLSNLKIDKYVELVNHDMQNVRKLAEKLIEQLETVHMRGKQCGDFFRETEQKGINVLTLSPLMLFHMIRLWHDDRPLGKTKCQIYSNIIEFILQHGIARLSNLTMRPIPENHIGLKIDPPACIKDHKYFKKYFCHIIDLGEFAFKALISEGREANLQEIHFFLKVGLLTERMSYEMAEHLPKFCFIHKTFQEYFCALYLSMLPDEEFEAKIAESCTSVESILALSDMIVFLSGLRPTLMNCVSRQLRSVIATDSLTSSYRRTIGNSIDWEKRYKQMKQLQKFTISCVAECTDDLKHMEIYLEDVFIDKDCETQSIGKVLNTIIEINAQSLKSIKIYGCNNTGRISSYLKTFNLYQVGALDKLEVVGHLEENEIIKLLSKSARTLKCLTLCKVPRRYRHQTKTKILTPMKSLNVMQSMPNLESLMLESFRLPHSQLEELFEFISRRHTMKQIAVGLLQCSDHRMECSGFVIDLSKHSSLQMLELGDIPLSDVKVNTTGLERCRIGKFDPCSTSSLNVLSKVLNCLLYAKELQELMVFDFESQEEVKNILKSIPSLEKLQVIIFKRIDVEEQRLILPKSVNHIKLCDVQMSSVAFRNIVDRTENVPVKFELLGCRITPQNEYKTIKYELRNSSHYEIWCDEHSQESEEQFVFTTVPTARMEN